MTKEEKGSKSLPRNEPLLKERWPRCPPKKEKRDILQIREGGNRERKEIKKRNEVLTAGPSNSKPGLGNVSRFVPRGREEERFGRKKREESKPGSHETSVRWKVRCFFFWGGGVFCWVWGFVGGVFLGGGGRKGRKSTTNIGSPLLSRRGGKNLPIGEENALL